MKANKEDAIEKLVSNIMSDIPLDNPSEEFTSKVMLQLEGLMESKKLSYQPLISKKGWLSILVLIIALITYFILNNSEDNAGWFMNINYSLLFDNIINNTISKFKFSKTVFYAILIMSTMLIVQVPILKSYFNKRAVL